MGNLDLYNRVRTVPQEAKKEIKGGRISGMTDINPMWRIKKLTEEFGMCGIGWYYKVLEKRIESSEQESSAFVDIELYIKTGNEWSMPIFGTGGSSFIAMQKQGTYMSDECFKMATTDALSVACKQLGIGADVYFSRDSESKYSSVQNKDNVKKEEKIYCCENCKEPFKPFEFKGRKYSSEESYNNAKKVSNGQALCKKCVAKLKESTTNNLTQPQINTLLAELKRVGYEERFLFTAYNVKSAGEMTIEQFKKCMNGLEMLPALVN